jgi:hypothetical protein
LTQNEFGHSNLFSFLGFMVMEKLVWGPSMAVGRSSFRATMLAVAVTLRLSSPLFGQNSQPAPSSAAPGQSEQPFTSN